VILATTDTRDTSTSSVAPVSVPAPAAHGIRYDGGPEEGTAAISARPSGISYDGGPEEGAAAISSIAVGDPPGIRYDGGPEEGTRSISR
jgi:hypothetical protein